MIENIKFRGPKEQSLSKLHGMLKPQELNDLLESKEISLPFDTHKAYHMYGLYIIIGDYFTVKFKDENMEEKIIKVKSMEDTENPKIKIATFVVLPSRQVFKT